MSSPAAVPSFLAAIASAASHPSSASPSLDPADWRLLLHVLVDEAGSQSHYTRGLAARALGCVITRDRTLRQAASLRPDVSLALADVVSQCRGGDPRNTDTQPISLNCTATLNLQIASLMH